MRERLWATPWWAVAVSLAAACASGPKYRADPLTLFLPSEVAQAKDQDVEIVAGRLTEKSEVVRVLGARSATLAVGAAVFQVRIRAGASAVKVLPDSFELQLATGETQTAEFRNGHCRCLGLLQRSDDDRGIGEGRRGVYGEQRAGYRHKRGYCRTGCRERRRLAVSGDAACHSPIFGNTACRPRESAHLTSRRPYEFSRGHQLLLPIPISITLASEGSDPDRGTSGIPSTDRQSRRPRLDR